MKAAGFLPYQYELRQAVRENPVVVVDKSRRTGYSWAAGLIAVEHAARQKSGGGMDVYYMGYNLEMAREFIDYCGDWAKVLNIGAGSVGETLFSDPNNPDRDIKAFRMELSSGFSVVALPSVPRALRGMQGLVILDEAAFHDDLAELLKAAFALLIWGGRVLVISTHDGDTNPFNTLIQDILSGRKPYKHLRCDFDRALREGLYKRICLKAGKEWSAEAQAQWRQEIIDFYGDGADEELFCIPSRGTGSYLPPALVESRTDPTIPVIRLALPDEFAQRPDYEREAVIEDWCAENLKDHLKGLDKSVATAFGEDFARSGDLTVMWPVQILRSMVRRAVFVLELRNVPFEQQRQILFYIIDRLPRFMAGALDATGNGAYLAEVAAQRYGWQRIAQVKLSEKWYAENMPPFKAAFEDDTTLMPRDADLVSDHRAVKLIRGVAKVPRDERAGSGKSKRHGDGAIAHALAYAASRMDVAPVEVVTGASPEEHGIFEPEADPTSYDNLANDWSGYGLN